MKSVSSELKLMHRIGIGGLLKPKFFKMPTRAHEIVPIFRQFYNDPVWRNCIWFSVSAKCDFLVDVFFLYMNRTHAKALYFLRDMSIWMGSVCPSSFQTRKRGGSTWSRFSCQLACKQMRFSGISWDVRTKDESCELFYIFYNFFY